MKRILELAYTLSSGINTGHPSLHIDLDFRIDKAITEFFIDIFLKSDSSERVDTDGYMIEFMDELYAFYTDNRIIQDHIGKMKYSDFLETPFWKIIANWKKNYLNTKCQICCNDSSSLHVHHFSYSRHGKYYEDGENDTISCYPLADLITVCESCHKIIHKHVKIK